jgi:AraC-like DNA-binding protein
VERLLLERPWVSLVLSGVQEVRTDREPIRARAGEALLLPPLTVLERAVCPGPGSRGWRAIELEVTGAALARGPLMEGLFARSTSPGHPVLLDASRSALSELLRLCATVVEATAHPRLLEHQLEGVLLALALDHDGPASDCARARFDLPLALRRLVRAEPAGDLSLGALARRLGLSTATLRRRLSSHRTSARRVVCDERMAIARLLLGDGRLTVNEVAVRCGYDAPAKFSRQFRRAFGVLPSSLRRTGR